MLKKASINPRRGSTFHIVQLLLCALILVLSQPVQKGGEDYMTFGFSLEPKSFRNLSNSQSLDQNRKDYNNIGDQYELFPVHRGA